MEFIDKYTNVIKAYDIPNVYLPGCLLIPCDKYGESTDYDCDMIQYDAGRVMSCPGRIPLRKIDKISAYYKVYRKDSKDTELMKEVERFIFWAYNRERIRKIKEEY